MIAAAEGHGRAVSALLESGADANGRNTRGRTALMFASRYGFTPIAENLIHNGADVNAVPYTLPRWPALIAAAYAGQIDIVRLLIANGATVSYRDDDNKTAEMWANEQNHTNVALELERSALNRPE
jgi:hypothetical protein